MFINNENSKNYLYTFLNQIWQFISGPIMLICIPLFLTPLQQGYWYTFSSLAALSVFANLGFTLIVQQFAAHEYAFLKIDAFEEQFIGDQFRKEKLGKFFVFSIKWACVTGGIVYFLIAIFGSYFLSTKKDDILWQIPWILYLIATFIQFVNTTICSFFEGCNRLYVSQNINLQAAVLACVTSVLVLCNNGNIFALGVSVLVQSIYVSFKLYHRFGKLMVQLVFLSKKCEYKWWNEFRGLLSKYAVTWISSYLLIQTIVPIIFHYYGAIFAGQVGFSVAIFLALSNLSRAWIFAINPQLNMAVARKEWNKLEELFNRNFLYSIISYIVGAITFFIIIYLFNDFFAFKRLAPFITLLLISLVWFFQLIFNNIQAYLRSYRVEPLMRHCFVISICSLVLTYFCIMFLSKEYVVSGMMISCFVLDICACFIYSEKRRTYKYELVKKCS